MNLQQRRYALDRLESIYRTHVTRIQEDAKQSTREPLTTAQKILLIRARKAVFVKPAELDKKRDPYGTVRGPYLVDCYTYPQEGETERVNSQVEELKAKQLETLKAMYASLKDALMLDGKTITSAELDTFENQVF